MTPQKPLCSLMRERNGVDSDGRGGEEELGVEGGETEVRIYSVKKYLQ